jgi:transcriptional regulator with XRE-family HTH domain
MAKIVQKSRQRTWPTPRTKEPVHGLESFQGRLMIAAHNRNISDLARDVGVSRSALYKWLGGKSEPAIAKLAAFARATDSSVSWLVSGEGSWKAQIADYVIPNSGGNRVPLAIDQEWLKQHSTTMMLSAAGATAARQAPFLYLVEIEDDSMEPTLKRGELVLADANAGRGERNGVYAIGFQSKELLAKPERANQPTVRFVVRRVQHHLDHKSLTISCDNRAYASETHTWTREEGRAREGVVVLAWVFWHGSFL